MKAKITERKKYVNVPIPAALAGKVDEMMRDSKMAYRTKTEFVIDCVRERLREEDRNKKGDERSRVAEQGGAFD